MCREAPAGRRNIMPKGLPYFKFDVAEWTNGNITLEDHSTQGVFINACAYYWGRSGDVTVDHFHKRFRNAIADIDLLIESGIIDVNGDQIAIKFLDTQLDERKKATERNRINGKKGGRPPKNPEITESVNNKNPNESHLEENRVEEKRIEEKRIEEDKKEKPGGSKRFVKPSFEEVRTYCIERTSPIDPESFIDHYTANGWRVGGKSPMKDWKAAVRQWERRHKQDSSNDNGGTLEI